MAPIVAHAHEMASLYTERDGSYRVQLYLPNGSRKLIHLGKVSRSDAKYFLSKLESILLSAKVGRLDTDPEWISRLPDRIAEKLESWGLCSQRKRHRDMRLEAMIAAYCDSRADLKPITLARLKAAGARMVEELGNRHISSITDGDAGRYASTLRSKLGSSTAGRELKRARQFFTAWAGDRLIQRNPFSSVSVHSHADQGRSRYIEPATITAILEKIACPEIKAVVALARYCGLRIPSEPMALKWIDVDWEKSRLTIRSAKLEAHGTAIRQCPIFPEARPFLDALWDLQLHDTNVFSRYRSSAATHYRSNLIAAIEKAGIEAWPKLWVNLRASCRTDLEKRFPNHVCNAWLGHSGKVAEKHYLRVNDEDWKEALCK